MFGFVAMKMKLNELGNKKIVKIKKRKSKRPQELNYLEMRKDDRSNVQYSLAKCNRHMINKINSL